MKEAQKLQLIEKVKENDVAWVDSFLSSNPAYCYLKTEQHESLLHLAACTPGAAMFNTIELYTNPQDDEDELPRLPSRAFTDKSENVLHYALHAGNIELCELLVRQNPEMLLQKNISGETPFDILLKQVFKEGGNKYKTLLTLSFAANPATYKIYIKGQYSMKEHPLNPEEKVPAYGRVDYDGMLVACAEKKARRVAKGKVDDLFVVIDRDEFKILLERLKLLPPGSNLTLQFAQGRGHGEHWTGGEIRLRNNNLDVMFFDSVSRIEYTEPYVHMVKAVFPNANIRTNFDVMQSGSGQNCAILVQNFMFHASNQSEFGDLMEYMSTHQATELDVEKIRTKEIESKAYRNDGTNVSDVLQNTLRKAHELGVQVGKLPLRLIRDMESLSRIGIRESEEKELVLEPVNHKGQSFIESRSQHLQEKGFSTINGRSLDKFTARIERIASFSQQLGFRERLASHTVGGFLGR